MLRIGFESKTKVMDFSGPVGVCTEREPISLPFFAGFLRGVSCVSRDFVGSLQRQKT